MSPATLSAPPSGTVADESRIPAPLTSFIGREREITEVKQLLQHARLVTLTGAGGSGKTRLALEVVSAAAAEFADGVVWVDLAPLTEAELLIQQVAAAVGVREEGGRSYLGGLVDFLRSRSLLLVLDNCEHLVEQCAALADALLRGAPALRIFATSREALGVAGEHAWHVPPLSLTQGEPTSAEELLGSEAARLFAERAASVVADFRITDANAAAVAEICRRLDGIPLALELAAARVKVLSPEQIRERLSQAFRILTAGGRTAIPRHRTLRAAIDWSYDLLSEDKKLFLQRLSVFSGGFTLEAAEAVCIGDPIEPFEVLDLLAQLVDRSLLVVQEERSVVRYHLLETVRQYAEERLGEAEDRALLQRRHADFFAEFVRQAEPHLTTVRRREWIELLLRDVDNVRQALAWTREHDPRLHVEMAGRLCWFWFSSRFWSEGRRWLEGAMTLPEAAERSLDRARLLFAPGVLASLQGQPPVARPWLEESAAIAAELGDHRQEAYALNYLGMVLAQVGSPEGKAHLDRALAWFRANGDPYGLRLALLLLGTLAVTQGDLAGAEEFAGEGVEVARSFGQDRELAIALQVLTTVALAKGELARAASLLRESLAALQRDPFYVFIARGIETLAMIAAKQGAMEHAVRLLGAAEAIRGTIGAAAFKIDQDRIGPVREAARTALGDEAFERLLAAGRAIPSDRAVELAIEMSGSSMAPAGAVPLPPPVAAAPSPPAAVAAPPVALRVLALGPLEIYREGALLGSDVWRMAKPRELLVYLLCHPGGRTREQIGLAFWPDASPAQVRNSFHVMLHHLRKTLGASDWVVIESERYRVNPERGLEFDVARFESELSEVLAAARNGGTSAERLRSVLDLYRGDLLGDEVVGDWHLEHRDRLRGRHLEGLLALAELHFAREEYAGARWALERVVRTDDLREDAHRRLMVCHVRMGEQAQALRHYERLTALLRAELDTDPEPETRRLVERIRQGEPV